MILNTILKAPGPLGPPNKPKKRFFKKSQNFQKIDDDCLIGSSGSQISHSHAVGTAVPGDHCAMVPWCYGTMVAWYRGTMVPWYHGAMVPGYHGTWVPWYLGTMVLFRNSIKLFSKQLRIGLWTKTNITWRSWHRFEHSWLGSLSFSKARLIR